MNNERRFPSSSTNQVMVETEGVGVMGVWGDHKPPNISKIYLDPVNDPCTIYAVGGCLKAGHPQGKSNVSVIEILNSPVRCWLPTRV
jgi:hypothetical protein